jgi:hypothetical protein
VSTEVIVALVMAHSDSKGLAEVSAVVQTLMNMGRSREQAIAAVLAAAGEEVIELRPEGGFSRFSAAELERCPVMSDGRTRLTYARVLP